MSKPSKIYLKNGRVISLKMRKFKLDENRFTFYDSDNDEIERFFVKFDEVAAVVIEDFDKGDHTERFFVYLKESIEPIEIWTSNFTIDDSPEVIFHIHLYGGMKNTLKNLYIAKSEIIAILPADRLEISVTKAE